MTSRSPEHGRLVAALDRMPRQQRAVFLAVRDEELDFATIGAALLISTAEVETVFIDALVRLARAAEAGTFRGRCARARRLIDRLRR